MKAKLLFTLMLTSCLLTFNYALTSYGDDQGDEQEQESHDEDGPDDGDIDGNESLQAKVILVATTNAPADATGCAKIEAENEDGAQTVTLEVKTKGLDAGDYNLSAVRKSDGSTVDLGVITINAVSCDGDDEDEDEDEDHDGEHISQTSSSSHDEDGDDNDDDEDEDGDHQGGDCGALRSESEVTLPPDLDPMDIAQIILSDTAGNALLVGDFVNVTSGTSIKFKAHIRVAPDSGAPEAQGTAVVMSSAKKGSHKNRFTMVASGVPANSTFNVEMNGTQVGTVKSNKKGKVLVKKLPSNLLGLRHVKLKDSQGNTAAHAKF
jgi:hypothetical protein